MSRKGSLVTRASKPKQKGPQAYVVQEIYWAYNDQYYYTEEGDPGAPVKAFLDKTRAESICEEKNIMFFKSLIVQKDGHGIFDYLGEDGPDQIDDIEKFAKIIEDAGGEFDAENWTCRVPEETPYEVLKRLYEMVPVTFYEVKEIDLDTWPNR